MKKVLTLTTLLITISIAAQVAPSPDAMAVANAGNPEDLYRGYVTEIVPLYTVEANNGFQVPINLLYQTRGIKVDDIASSVGLGWNLSAGGAITRVMRGQPDDQSPFYESPTQSDVQEAVDNHKKGYDFEKDIFYYSFPGGGGKFISTGATMVYTGGPVVTNFYGLPYTDNKIDFVYTGYNNSSWIITDVNGIKYYFGSTSDSREITQSLSYEQGSEPEENGDFTYISTWYLDKIVFPNLPNDADNVIEFTYVNDQELSNSRTVSSKSYDLEEDHKMYLSWRNDGQSHITFYDPAYINNNNQNPTVTFNFQHHYYGTETLPIGASFPKPFSFTYYDMFNDSRNCGDIPNCSSAYSAYQNYQPWPDFPLSYILDEGFNQKYAQYYSAQSGGSTKNTIHETTIEASRLTEISSQKATVVFEWGSRSDISSLKKIDRIDVYDHDNIIRHEIDMTYSYFNAGCTPASDCKRLKLTSVSKNDQVMASYEYMDEATSPINLPERSSVAKDVYGYYNSSVAGKYGNVIYKNIPFKNNSLDPAENNVPFYEYSANNITLGNQDRSVSSDARAGSLWRINYLTGAQKTFSYQAKSTGGVAVSNILLEDGSGSVSIDKSYSYSESYGVEASLHTPIGLTVTLFSDSPYLGYDHLSIGGYRYVTVSDNLTGTSSEYEFYLNKESESSEKSHWSSSWTRLDDLPDNSGPMLPASFSPFPGLPKNVTVKDAGGEIVRTEYFDYLYNETPAYTITEHAISKADNGEYAVAEVDQKCRPLYLNYRKVVSREDDTDVIENTTTYFYNSTYKTFPYLVRTERTDGSGAEAFNTDVRTYYPFSGDIKRIHSQATLDEMVSKNMIGIPVQVLNLVQYPGASNPEVTKGSITTYRKQHGFIQPYEVYTSTLKDPALLSVWDLVGLKKVSTSSFNDLGLLESQITKDGIEITYSYDSEGYLTSKTIKPDPNDNTMDQTTTYTYKNLVGVETVTGPTLETTTYEYDDRNRLQLIRDDDDNIIKRYRYNYAGEDHDLSAEISISGPILAGASQTISATNVNGYGAIDFKWYNGSGTLLSTSKSFNRSFGAGTHTIQLVLTSPEHDAPFTAETTKTFYNEWSLGSIFGSSTVCLEDENFEDPGDGSMQIDYSININYGATTCGSTANNFTFQWEHNQSGFWQPFGDNQPEQELPHILKTQSGSFQIRVKVTPAGCSTKTSAEKTITVESCGGTGGTGGTGGNDDLSITVGTLDFSVCPGSSATIVASIENGSCSGISYTWEMKQGTSGVWQSISGSGSSITLDYNDFGGTGTFYVKATTVGCSTTASDESNPINVGSTCF